MVDVSYAAAVKYVFSNSDFSGAGLRYRQPSESWSRFSRLLGHLGNPERLGSSSPIDRFSMAFGGGISCCSQDRQAIVANLRFLERLGAH